MLAARVVTRGTESVDVILDQGAAGEIRSLERELSAWVAEDPKNRSSARARELAQEIEDVRRRMAGSVVTFKLRSLSRPDMASVIESMDGRIDQDEQSLRTYAAMITDPAGTTWEDLQTLRDGDGGAIEGIGADVFAATIVAAADRAVGELDVPFSLPASQILAMQP